MAQIPFRANLNAAQFPFLSIQQGRTTIVQAQDQNYTPAVTQQNQPLQVDDKDRGIPQIYYCHNVVPSAQGLASIGYSQQAAAISVSANLLTKRFAVRDSSGNFCFLSQGSDGHTYILDSSGVWKTTIADVAGYTNGLITVAYVAGVTYIYFQGATDPCRQYNFGTNNLDIITLTGVIANVIGVTTAAGYLLAWSKTAIAWSSTILATDFTPSLTTGAGSGGVEGAKGALTFVIPILNGMIVYTQENSVAGVYSGNSRYPFNFREIVGSGGVNDINLVAFDASSGNHYAYTSSGLQLVSPTATTTVFPDATDFIAGKIFEDFNESTLLFELTVLNSLMLKRIAMIADRYLVISYGINEYTHALLYDVVNKRWGKFKRTHVEVFEWHLLSSSASELPRESIAFLSKDGTIATVDFAISSTSSAGVLLLGKYQYIRQRTLTLDEVAVEEITPNRTFALYDLTTRDGKNFQTAVAGALKVSTEYYRNYRFHKTGVNHSLLFVGAFYLSSIVMKFHVNGTR
jgi:hypothetical protein